MSRAAALPFRTFQRLKMFGIESTWMRASGRLRREPVQRVGQARRKLATEVIVASLEVQTSLAPISIRMRSGLPATAVCACPVARRGRPSSRR